MGGQVAQGLRQALRDFPGAACLPLILGSGGEPGGVGITRGHPGLLGLVGPEARGREEGRKDRGSLLGWAASLVLRLGSSRASWDGVQRQALWGGSRRCLPRTVGRSWALRKGFFLASLPGQ